MGDGKKCGVTLKLVPQISTNLAIGFVDTLPADHSFAEVEGAAPGFQRKILTVTSSAPMILLRVQVSQ